VVRKPRGGCRGGSGAPPVPPQRGNDWRDGPENGVAMRWRGEEVPPVARGQRQAMYLAADGEGRRCAGTRRRFLKWKSSGRFGGGGRAAARMPEPCQGHRRTEFDGDREPMSLQARKGARFRCESRRCLTTGIRGERSESAACRG
jgi:hypothetical protein